MTVLLTDWLASISDDSKATSTTLFFWQEMSEQLWDRKRKLCEEVGNFKKTFFPSILWFVADFNIFQLGIFHFSLFKYWKTFITRIYSLDRISQVLETLKILEPGLTVRLNIWPPHILFTLWFTSYHYRKVNSSLIFYLPGAKSPTSTRAPPASFNARSGASFAGDWGWLLK